MFDTVSDRDDADLFGGAAGGSLDASLAADDLDEVNEAEGIGARSARKAALTKRRSLLTRTFSTTSDSSAGKKGGNVCCGVSCTDLSRRDRAVLWLYFIMIIGAAIAVTAVTVDFAKQAINPGSFIRSEQSESLPAPVVTVCLSQTGVPFSRLQLFNFTDAEGRNLRGADPQGPQNARASSEFTAATERFWDNPGNEDCDAKVGDFFPFPVESLNRLTAGEESTRCRPCYRVGSRQLATVTSTDFRDSSVLSFYTDNYFLQCLKSINGLNEASLDFLRQQMFDKREDMERLGVLSSTSGAVDELDRDVFDKVDPKMACNAFYFGFFPKSLETGTGGVDTRYEYDGSEWNAVGDGPYLNLKESIDFLPQESLQLFVGKNSSSRRNEIGTNRDMILIGPNTQTFATFRPVIVYDEDRYDISSSTSNLMESDVIALFGYWLVYRIYYNFNRFVVDEYYQDSTYPASQWLVDLTGYASLFTGASLFSLLLLPILRSIRKREKVRLRKEKPEVYVWQKMKRKFKGQGEEGAGAAEGDTDRGGVLLPGYNV